MFTKTYSERFAGNSSMPEDPNINIIAFQEIPKGVADSLLDTIRTEGTRNEIRIAWVRVITLSLATIFNLILWQNPPTELSAEGFSITNAIAAGIWLAVAVIVVIKLYLGFELHLMQFVLQRVI